MSNDAIVQKVLIDLETKKAKEEMRALAASSTDTKQAFIALRARADELEKSVNSIKSASGKLVPEFKSVTNVMTALNQGLEVGKKLFNLAEEGLDAYAKTSRRAAEDVRGLKTEFAHWRDYVMEHVGEIAVALGKSLPSVPQMEEIAKRMHNTGKNLHDAAADVQKEAEGTGSVINSAFSALANFDYDGISKGIGDKVGSAFQKAAEDAKKASAETLRWRLEMAAIGNRLVGNETPADRAIRAGAQSRAEFQADVDRATDQMYRDEERRARENLTTYRTQQSLSAAGSALQEAQAALEGLQRDRQKTLLESVFGPVEQVDLYKQSFEALGGVFQSFSAAVGASYEAIVTGSGSVSAAFKQVFANSLMAMGKSSAIEAIRELALGFGSLALGPLGGPSASMHFKSAALHGAVAVAAGAAAAGLGAGGSQAAAASGGSSGGGRPNGGTVTGGGTGIRTPGGTSSTIIVYADPFADGSPGVRRRNAKKVLERAKGGGDWEDS